MSGLSLGIRAIDKRYRDQLALPEFSAEFRAGGVYVLMGPNGCGKSTLLRLCALLETPDHGTLAYREGERERTSDLSLRRRITLLLPRIGLFNTSVLANAEYGLKLRGMRGDELRQRAREALDFVGLLNKQDQNALTLSSGESQRLGLARAIAVRPDVLLLDEPTASTDRDNTASIENILLLLRQRTHSLIVIATHSSAQAQKLGDEIIRMG